MDYPIKGFAETSFSDWPGKVAAVLFLPACNFRCHYCHNHELVLAPERFANFPLEVIIRNLQKHKGWIDGVCISGGEPTLHDWLPSLIRDLKSASGFNLNGAPLGIKLDTNGSRPEVLQQLIKEDLLDYVAMDLKGPLERERYSAIAGVSLGEEGLTRIQTSVQLLLEGNLEYEFRTTVVPTLLEEEELYALARRIRGAQRFTLQPFNPRETLNAALRNVSPYDASRLDRIQERVNEIIGREN